MKKLWVSSESKTSKTTKSKMNAKKSENAGRGINKKRYIMAVFLTAAIFSMGLGLGVYLDIKKIDYVRVLTEEQAADLDSLQFQYLYLASLKDSESCPVIEKTLESNLNTLQPILNRLIEYENEVGIKVSQRDYEQVKREYTLANLRYWLLAQKSREVCGADLVRVLYFYSPDCASCPDEGFILSNLRLGLDDKLLIFPLDASFTKEPMISILLSQYNVTTFPTLVIEDDVVRQFASQDELLKIICPKFKHSFRESNTLCASVSEAD